MSSTRNEPASQIVVFATGDISFGRDTGKRLLRDKTFNPFVRMLPLLASADVRFGNLESPLSDQGGQTRHPNKPLVFTGPPLGAEVLKRASFEVVSLANNHIWDYGARGFADTLWNLEQQGIRFAGAARTSEGRDSWTVLDVSGWSLAFIAATDVWNASAPREKPNNPHVAFADRERIRELVRNARAKHDLVLVSYHGGKEYSEHIAPEQRAFAKAIMEAGADIMLGHHPHVPQGIEWFDGRPALYSLGNFMFERHRAHPWTGRGYAARVTFRRARHPEVELCPYVIDKQGPAPLRQDDLLMPGFRQHLRRIAQNADWSEVAEPNELGCLPISARPSKTSVLGTSGLGPG